MLVQRVSHSSVRDYLKCPALFFYRHVLKLELDEKPIHLHFGKCLHRGLELYHKNGADPIQIFKDEFKPDDLADEDTKKYFELLEQGEKMLEYYLQNVDDYKLKLGIQVIKTEEKLMMEQVVDPSTKNKLLFDQLTGVIDFETADERLGDYKTSSHKYTQQEIDESMQPTFYYLLYYLEHGKLPKSFIYIVFLKKRKRDMIQILETNRTMEDITKLVEIINEIYAKVEKKQFDRQHDDSTYCDCLKYEELLKI